MNDITNVSPFNKENDIDIITIYFRVIINDERNLYAFNLRKFNELGGDNATGVNWYTAQAFKHEAEIHNYACDLLEKTADELFDILTPKAFDRVIDVLSNLDRYDREHHLL